jgi:hypothetical protein
MCLAWWWGAAKDVGWDATWSMSTMKKRSDELWTDYIDLHMQRLFHGPFWDIRLCAGFPWDWLLRCLHHICTLY